MITDVTTIITENTIIISIMLVVLLTLEVTFKKNVSTIELFPLNHLININVVVRLQFNRKSKKIRMRNAMAHAQEAQFALEQTLTAMNKEEQPENVVEIINLKAKKYVIRIKDFQIKHTWNAWKNAQNQQLQAVAQ